jgi:precorrin-2 dehydrogenase/sirohydrochlorin ferrochelatase
MYKLDFVNGRLLIIDLHLNGKTVVIVGAGTEALKRIKLLENEECQIIVIGEKPNSEISKLSRTKKITLKKIKLNSSLFLKKYKPFLVIASTTDRLLNQKIVQTAKKMKILAYASDSPELSDISYLSLIDIKKTIKVAISTGGSSPIMAKKIKSKTEKCLKKNISNQDIQLIKFQKFARNESKKFISTQVERKKFLYALMNNKRVKELLKDGKYKPIQTIIKKMVKNWR